MKVTVPCHNNIDPIKPTAYKSKKMCELGKIPRRNGLEERKKKRKKRRNERKYFRF